MTTTMTSRSVVLSSNLMLQQQMKGYAFGQAIHGQTMMPVASISGADSSPHNAQVSATGAPGLAKTLAGTVVAKEAVLGQG